MPQVPLWEAGSGGLLRLLLQGGADPSLQDDHGRIPLHIVVRFKYRDQQMLPTKIILEHKVNLDT